MRISSFFSSIVAWYKRFRQCLALSLVPEVKRGVPESFANFTIVKNSPHCWGSPQCLSRELRLQFEACMNFSEIGFWMVDIAPNGEICSKNEVFYSPSCLLFVDEKRAMPRTSFSFWASHIHPEDLKKMQERYPGYLRGEIEGTRDEFIIEVRFHHKTKGWRWIRLVGMLFAADNALYLSGMAQDVTKAHQLQQELEKQMLFQRELLEILPNPVFIKDENGCFITFNRAYEEAFGMKREDFIGKNVMDLEYFSIEDRLSYQKEDLELIRTGKTVQREIDFDFADGKKHHCLYWSNGLRNDKKGVKGLMGLIVDITEQQETEEILAQKVDALNIANAEIEKISRIDSLTGLSNRRELMENLQQIISISDRHGGIFSVIMMDLDNFKCINDTYGHGVGDDVLQRFAEATRKICREEDTAARIGGEEFLVLLPMTSETGGLVVAERIRDTIHNDEREPCFTVSMGVVQYDALQPEDASHLLHRADQAMYRAKNDGKDCIRTALP